MLLKEVKEQVFKLPPQDRLSLVTAIIESLQDIIVSDTDCSSAIQRMRGSIETNQSAPTDEEVANMLDERRKDKFLL